MEYENIQLKNYMEDIVNMLIDHVLKDVDVCKCRKCMLDITAMALNQLPPKYIVTEKGELFSKINTLRQQFEVDVVSAITKASVVVKGMPRHDA